MLDVPVAHGLRQEQLDLGSEQLGAVVAEQLADPLVQLRDAAAGLDAHQRVRGGLEEGRQRLVELDPHAVGRARISVRQCHVTSP